MNLLVLGGTLFLGRHLVEAALDRGHQVTLFNRGQTHPELFPDVPRLVGDRNQDLGALERTGWDAVIDPTAYNRTQIEALVAVLGDRAGFYALVSTGSVYPLQGPKTEESPVVDDDEYGGNKARAEGAALQWMRSRTLVARSGLIAGPWDPTNRFTYWVTRIARGGEVLAPAGPERQVQFIHARDQVEWILDMVERRAGGTYNVSGPPTQLGHLFDVCRRVARSHATFTWVPDEFLEEHKVGPYMELPLWIPRSAGDLDMPNQQAVAAGLRFRPLEQTVAETLAWAEAQLAAPPDVPARYGRGGGLSEERERDLLALWHAQL